VPKADAREEGPRGSVALTSGFPIHVKVKGDIRRAHGGIDENTNPVAVQKATQVAILYIKA